MFKTMKDAHKAIVDSGMTTINAGGLAFIMKVSTEKAQSLINALHTNGYLTRYENTDQYRKSQYFDDNSNLHAR